MQASKPTTTFLCLLDDVDLASDVRLGRYLVKRYKWPELARLLRGRDDPPTEVETQELKRFAMFPWAFVEMPVNNYRVLRELCNGLADVTDLDFARTEFMASRGLRSRSEPFDELVRTLNLLKPAGGPVIPRAMCFRPFHDIQTKEQVLWDVFVQPLVTNPSGPDGDAVEIPRLAEYKLGPGDAEPFQELAQQLDRCLLREPAAGCPANAHLRIAVHYFERADARFGPSLTAFDVIDPLMAYEAALEALLIPEKETNKKKSTHGTLASRACAIVGADFPPVVVSEKTADGRYEHVARRATPADLKGFVEKTFWVRSKVAHGVRMPEALADLIDARGDDGIENGRRGDIPGGPYTNLFMLAGLEPLPGFLVNLRELVRRCIRYFCDEYDQGRSREESWKSLDGCGPARPSRSSP